MKIKPLCYRNLIWNLKIHGPDYHTIPAKTKTYFNWKMFSFPCDSLLAGFSVFYSRLQNEWQNVKFSQKSTFSKEVMKDENCVFFSLKLLYFFIFSYMGTAFVNFLFPHSRAYRPIVNKYISIFKDCHLLFKIIIKCRAANSPFFHGRLLFFLILISHFYF